MRKQYKRVLASAMAAILIWNTCGWQVPALAASVVYQVEEIEQLPEEVLYQEVPYGTKYKDLELPDKLKMLVLTEDEETWDEEADDGGLVVLILLLHPSFGVWLMKPKQMNLSVKHRSQMRMRQSKQQLRPMQMIFIPAKTGKMLRSAGCCAKIAVKKKHMLEKLRVSMYSMRS